MSRFLDKKSLRITASVLAFLFLAIGALGVSIVEYGIEDRWYRPDTVSFEDTRGCEAYVYDALYYIERNMGWLPEAQWDTLGSYAGNAFSYIITGPYGVVANTLTQQSIYVGAITATQDASYDAGRPGEYTIEGFVNLPVGMYDGCYREYLMFDTMFGIRYRTALLTLMTLLLAAAMFSFAVASTVRAGKRSELRILSLLPFDGMFLAVSLLFIGLSSFLQQVYVDLVGYYTNYTGFMLIDNIASGISVLCWGSWFLVLGYLLAAHCSAKTLKERLLIIMLSRRISMAWWVAAAAGVHFALFLLWWYYDQNIWGIILIGFDLLLVALLAGFLKEAQAVRRGAEELAGGNLTYKIKTSRLHSIWWSLGGDLNKIGDGMANAVEEQMHSERMKTELITNVSHDLKTPLTSIINYVHFLKDDTIDPATKAEYLDILDRQSAKLKKLTEDVVEASKAASGVLTVNMETLNAGELLEQSVGEYAERMRAVRLEPVLQIPEMPVHLSADSNLFGRVLENLMTNIVKYALPGTRVYFDVASDGENAVITAKNISRAPLNISADELMERFVRGDSSRHSEGSGLGLSIAQSLTELMGGTLRIILDGDLFKAEIVFKQV